MTNAITVWFWAALTFAASIQSTPTAGTAPTPATARQPAQLAAQFDADKDGRLAASERRALRQHIKVEWEKVLARFDADGDGKLNARERAQRLLAQRQERVDAAAARP